MRILYKDMEKFMAKVKKTRGCWNWAGCIDPFGYGHICFKSGKVHIQKAHRFAYLLHVGDIPKGKMVLHTCDNRRCVNPDHLYVGTQSNNMKDMWNRERRPRNTGEANGLSKLTEKQVREIKGMNHVTAVNLGRMYNVSEHTISAIRTGRSWSHVKC